ncbi:hypothetical protein DOTSEDRAFT_55096 [Dothistroma septosporum NZE10]|uniref:Uncharacterized protein n=1 Tax=Dothistroma septosporum (strain NZE10 / CBS 128990) TaxID=675120 RepID=N1PGH4_DOTSN|nr:hypothetical protein DOTSEDRAFT_55096 [Dothistroma septosporum NZE10]
MSANTKMAIKDTEDGESYHKLAEKSADEILRISKARLPLIIPWHPRETVRIGTLFHSSRHSDPWATNSPFLQSSLSRTPIQVQRDYGSQSTFRSQSTSRSTEDNDHFELGFGVGVGLPFLASVSVKGDYCKDVQENKDSNKTAVNFSCRAGYVSLESQPRLSTEAIITLKYNGGLSAFQERYGDYYLAGYRLGDETGILISGSNSHRRRLDRFAITVTVEVLFIETSKTFTKDFVKVDDANSFKIIGYDTLGHTQYDSMASGQAAKGDEIRKEAESYVLKAKTLDNRVSDALDELNVHDGYVVDILTCRKLVECRVVVELILLPVISLREVQQWVLEDNII